MPRLSTPETATADEAVDLTAGAAGDPATAGGGDDTPVAGASAVVEAATAEAAIAEVHERFGPGATIVEARRVLRGGIGGFFAKEHVQLHVASGPDGRDDDTPERDVRRDPAAQADIAARAVALAAELTEDAGHLPGTGSRGTAAGTPGTSPVDRLLAGGDTADRDDDPIVDDTVDFGTFLRNQLSREEGGGTAGAAEAPSEVPSEARGDAVRAASAQPEERGEAAAAATTEPEVQPMRWPGSHDPWSVYGVPATPAATAPAGPPSTDAEVAATPAEAATTDAEVPSGAPPQDPAAPTEPAGAVAEPSTAAATGTPVEGPAWSVTRLLHLGLPASLVHGLAVADPADDLSWVAALTDALRPVCRPLPVGPAVLVGPDAPAVAEVVDLPVARSRTWLDALGANRWRHLVIGGQGWRAELTDEPLAVSWVRTEDLPDALRCATELGLVLGYGPQGGQLRRARPLDIALAVRELVEMR